jgi:hypothetical protein
MAYFSRLRRMQGWKGRRHGLGSSQIFSKIRGKIRESMFISGVNDTGDKRENF